MRAAPVGALLLAALATGCALAVPGAGGEAGPAPDPTPPAEQPDAGGAPPSGDGAAAVAARCGDGTRDPGEACDDGATDDGDGCSGQCEVEPDRVISSTTALDQTLPMVAVGPDGTALVVWQDASATAPDTSGTAIRARRLDLEGAPIGADFVVNSTTALDQRAPAVAASPDGTWLVVWQDASATAPDTTGTAIRGRRLDAAGVPLGPDFPVNTTTAANQVNPRVAAGPDGAFLIAWPDRSLAAPDSSAFGIRARLLQDDGTFAGADFSVNTITTDEQRDVAVAGSPLGGYLVAWRDASLTAPDASGLAIRAQRLDDAGRRVGSELLVNSTTGGDQNNPAVVAAPDGGYLVAWQDGSTAPPDVAGLAVRARRVDAAGALGAADVVIDTTTASDQSNVALAVAADGSILALWQDASLAAPDADLTAIRARRLGPTGAPLDEADFVVTSTTAGAQTVAAAAATLAGGFLVVWQDGSGAAPDADGAAVRLRLLPDGFQL